MVEYKYTVTQTQEHRDHMSRCNHSKEFLISHSAGPARPSEPSGVSRQSRLPWPVWQRAGGETCVNMYAGVIGGQAANLHRHPLFYCLFLLFIFFWAL